MILQRVLLGRPGRLIAVIIVGVMMAGCGKQEDPRVAEFRQRVLVTSVAMEPSSIAATLAKPDLTSNGEVTIAGRIYGGKTKPFEDGEASFSLIELPEPGHNHDDPGDCPFCKHKLDEAAMAMVQICDSAGKPVNIAADKLLGLTEKQDIAVSGHAKKVGDLLLIEATTIQVLSTESSNNLASLFARSVKQQETEQETEQESE